MIKKWIKRLIRAELAEHLTDEHSRNGASYNWRTIVEREWMAEVKRLVEFEIPLHLKGDSKMTISSGKFLQSFVEAKGIKARLKQKTPSY